jgi:hypothetical protein
MKLVAEGLPHVQNDRRFFCAPGSGLSLSSGGSATVAGVRFFRWHRRDGGIKGGNSFGFEAFPPALVGALFVLLDSADTATGFATSTTALTAAQRDHHDPVIPAHAQSSSAILRSSCGVSAGLLSSIKAAGMLT